MRDMEFVDVNAQPEDVQDVGISRLLENIAGSSGSFQKISRSSLEPTPVEWNQFTPMSLEKKTLMVESIARNGLLQPIVVRAMNSEENRYQILAGNTRNEVFQILYDATNDPKYLDIDALVYKYGEISDEQAQEIVSDTNYVQRASLTAKDRAFCVHSKIAMLRKRFHEPSASIMEKAAEQLQAKKSTLYYWDRVAALPDDYFQMFDEGRIGLIAAARLAGFPEEVLEDLRAYKDLIENDIIRKIPANCPPDKIISRFLALVEEAQEQAEKTEEQRLSMKVTKKGCSIKISEPPPKGTVPVVLYLPESKVRTFRKTYDSYIVR